MPSLRPLFSRLSPRIFSNVFTNLRSLTRGVIILPAAPGRFYAGTGRRWCVCAFCARVYVQRREYATDATGAPFFSPVPSPLLLRLRGGGIHFAAQRPRLPRTAPFDCFDYPYFIPPRLIPSAHVLQTHSGGVFPPSLSPENPDLPFSRFPSRRETSVRVTISRVPRRVAEIPYLAMQVYSKIE